MGKSRRVIRIHQVLQEIINLLPGETTAVQQVTVDFEKWLWSALRTILLDVQIRGCLFHWTQALWRKVQELGLQVAYTEDQGTYGWVGKLLALTFLPYTKIITQFERLRLGAEGPRKELAEYIASQWIYNAIFPVKDWSVFMQPLRTNNDIEGWHHALNRRASGRCSLPFYVLIQLLNREARLVEVHMRLVADHKLTLIQRGNIAFCRPNCRISGSSTCYSP